MGELINRDTTLYRKFFKEQARLLGIKVQYRYPIDMDYTLHSQEDPLGYSEPIDLDIIFDASPKLKTLRKLGWVSEDPSDKPYMIQVPWDTPNLRKGCLIILPTPLPTAEGRVFRITDIQMDQIMPDSFYCKSAPYMEKMNALTPKDYKDKSYSFLKVDQDAT